MLRSKQFNNWNKGKIIVNNNHDGNKRKNLKHKKKPRKNKWYTIQLLTTHWLMPDLVPTHQSFPVPGNSPPFILSMMSYGVEYPSDHFRSRFLASRVFLHLLTGRAWDKNVSFNWDISILSTLLSYWIQTTAWYQILKRNWLYPSWNQDTIIIGMNY